LSRKGASPGWVASAGLFLLRAALGGLFVFAGLNKLFLNGVEPNPFAPESFAEAIMAFKLVDDDQLVTWATFMIPWTEIIAGAALILGLWSRGAALVIGLLLAAFIAAITSVIFRGIPVTNCSCFGQYKLLCGNDVAQFLKDQPPVGWCKVVENSILVLAAAVLLAHGGGRLSLDRLLSAGSGRRKA
jgi:uncharacterized membrane protein YphA (DoxX/SURF4 family)